jgi:hypothetical protein
MTVLIQAAFRGLASNLAHITETAKLERCFADAIVSGFFPNPAAEGDPIILFLP